MDSNILASLEEAGCCTGYLISATIAFLPVMRTDIINLKADIKTLANLAGDNADCWVHPRYYINTSVSFVGSHLLLAKYSSLPLESL